MSSWGCPHDLNGKCARVNNVRCDPGMKGCVLFGRFVWADESKNRPGELVLSLSDTGPGIPPEDMPFLFQRFHRHRAGGSGIGLAVVKALVEAQGGRVWAESRVGQGSTFYFTLPVAEAR